MEQLTFLFLPEGNSCLSKVKSLLKQLVWELGQEREMGQCPREPKMVNQEHQTFEES